MRHSLDKSRQGPRRQSGAVLLLAIFFLLLLALVSGTVMRTSMLEVQMAGNEQFREEAFQLAQAITTELALDISNFPVVGDVGYTACLATDTDPDCNSDGNDLQDPNSVVIPEGFDTSYQVVRSGPRFVESLPFRQSEDDASSSPKFDAAIFEVNVEIDGSAARMGNARVVQGVAIRVGASIQ